jgi:4-hydroxy-2-oxoheptanedioate aldolase
MGPGDLGLALGYPEVPREPYPPELEGARRRVFAACQRNGLAFLEVCSPANIRQKLEEGVRVVAGGDAETAAVGRAYQKRSMPV